MGVCAWRPPPNRLLLGPPVPPPPTEPGVSRGTLLSYTRTTDHGLGTSLISFLVDAVASRTLALETVRRSRLPITPTGSRLVVCGVPQGDSTRLISGIGACAPPAVALRIFFVSTGPSGSVLSSLTGRSG